MIKLIHDLVNKLGAVLKLMSTPPVNNDIVVNVLKGMKKDIDSIIKQIEGAGN